MVMAKPQYEIAPAPFAEAHVCLVEGTQGSGKNTTGVARVVDAYFKDCVRIFCMDVLHVNCEVKFYDSRTRIARIKHQGEMKLLHVPSSYKLHSPMRIFCNFHLYGIPYVFCPSFEYILDGLKSGLIGNGWLMVDEYYIGGNARECMTALGKELNKQSFQFRKMQLNVIIITPMARLIDWTMRMIPTEHILCSYNKNTRKVTLTIRRKGEKGTREVPYDATQYWPYFWTNERINA